MNETGRFVGMAFAAGLMAMPMAARAQVSLDVNIGPPPPRYEAVPAPRPGFVWAPGYWVRRENRWDWDTGRWVAARPGYHWAPDVWVRRGPDWHYVQGHWVR